MKVALRILHEITGSLFELTRANRKLNQKIDCLSTNDPTLIYQNDKRVQLCLDLLMQHLNLEDTRRRAIEDKAKTNVLGVTLAFSALFAGVALISSRSPISAFSVEWLNLVLVFLLVLSISFLLAGGWLALDVLRVKQIFTWTLAEETRSISRNDKAKRVVWYIDLKQMASWLKANKVHASYSCIRNGIIVLTVVAMALAVYGLEPRNSC